MSSTLRGSSRSERDFYPTPAWCVTSVYQALDLPWPTLDPGAGNGGLLRPIKKLYPRSCMRGIEIQGELAAAARVDGLDVRTGDGFAASWEGEHILMNPPYGAAEAWVKKAVKEASSALILLRLGYLGSQRRRAFWEATPPQALAVMSRRPSFTGTGCDSADYAWFFWSKQLSFGGTRMVWIG